MSRKYKFADNDKIYFATFTVTNWIDVFIRDEYREKIIDSIQYLPLKQLPINRFMLNSISIIIAFCAVIVLYIKAFLYYRIKNPNKSILFGYLTGIIAFYLVLSPSGASVSLVPSAKF